MGSENENTTRICILAWNGKHNGRERERENATRTKSPITHQEPRKKKKMKVPQPDRNRVRQHWERTLNHSFCTPPGREYSPPPDIIHMMPFRILGPSASFRTRLASKSSHHSAFRFVANVILESPSIFTLKLVRDVLGICSDFPENCSKCTQKSFGMSQLIS